MPKARTDDGIELDWQEHGSGHPLLFIHEFAGDQRSFAPQVEHFANRYRCIVYNARGYPPSDVPEDEAAYSQVRAAADALTVLDAAGAEQAHVVGVSMGGFCALHLALRHPDRVTATAIGGVGYGAQPEANPRFRRECEAIARAFRDEGTPAVAERYAVGPARVQFQNKNPDGWQLFADQLAEHDARGAELTMLGVQRLRPSLYEMRDELAAISVPFLILAGDEDEGCLEADLMLKRTIPSAGLSFLPRTGHTCNLEEPEVFNAVVEHFLDAVESGSWGLRDPRSLSTSVTGMDDD
ncbi:MAG TPA: alpha/beta hydrolase [Thermoleophilaceae bacterium]|jgi:pimeloyl-ACP methyl ester carboxylesterase